ncbi:phage repressor protein (plasmid) [Pantoea agglomerans]|uniref:phage repressor protein n=1 Tax=Enterobacter agglomerans TaxID=549 RepID=UPI003AAAE609
MIMPNPPNMMRIDTPEGFVLVDVSLTAVLGDIVAFQFDDYSQIGKLFRTGIITQDGETIDGEGLEGIIVLGKVTATIVAVYEPLRLTM